MDRDWDFVLLHSYRESNKTADFLAKLACTHGQRMITYAQPPNMEQVLQDDFLGCPIRRDIPSMEISNYL